MLYATGVDSGVGKRLVARGQVVIAEIRKAGLTVDNLLSVGKRDAGIVQVYGQATHLNYQGQPLVAFHVADKHLIEIILAVEDQSFLQQLQLINQKHQKDTDQQRDKC